MGLLGRFFGSRDNKSWSHESDRSLVESPQPSFGLGRGKLADLNITPWSATRLEGIFVELQNNPSASTLTQARKARHCLSKFWLGAPVDQLEILYRSPIGQCYRRLLASQLPALSLESGEQAWRQALSQRLMEQFDRPETINLLLASMPYFARGKMRVANPMQQVPQWLQADYAALFDPDLQTLLNRPAGLLGPQGSAGRWMAYPPQQLGTPQPQAQPQTASLPLMSARRGNEGLQLVQNGDYIGRMNGLLNLYSIDPSDAEVKRELIGLRRQLGQTWLDLGPEQLQAMFQTNTGTLYCNLLSSGFAKEELLAEDHLLRRQLGAFVGNVNHPKATNALLAALPFYLPGKIQLGAGAQQLPGWLLEQVNRYNGAATANR
jgi:hypothetical protein